MRRRTTEARPSRQTYLKIIMVLPNICQFWYTTPKFRPVKSTEKMREVATKKLKLAMIRVRMIMMKQANKSVMMMMMVHGIW